MTPVPVEIDLHTLYLRVADLGIQLDFGPGHDALAAEAAHLWAHLAADPTAETGSAGPELASTRRTYLAPPADARAEVARWVAAGRGDALGPLLTRPDAVILAPGPGAAYALSGDVTREIIVRLLGTRILLHAGVVAHPRFGVVALVGASGAGKSTASESLGRMGTYLTDELAIIDPANRALTAYPKPVSRVVESAETSRSDRVSSTARDARKQDSALQALGLRPADGAERVDVVVLLDRAEGAPPSLERVPLAEALLSLVEQSSSLWSVPRGLAVLAEVLSDAGGALRARYSEAAELEDLLSERPPPRGDAWEEVLRSERAESEATGTPGDARPDLTGGHDPSTIEVIVEQPDPGAFSLAHFAQALAVEDGLVLLAEGRATHLAGLGVVIWEELGAAGTLTADELTERIIAFAGPHPDSTAKIAAAISRLLEDGWIRRG